MTECYQTPISFSSVKRRRVELEFSGGNITSNAGIVLLSKVDQQIGLSQQIAQVIGDERRQASCEHSIEALIRQRVYGLALGYEDLNDHQQLRDDLALQTAISRDRPLASAATLSRFESKANKDWMINIHQVLFDQFVGTQKKPPRRLILDFDATDTPLHGEQEKRFFHGYYDHYCYLPLYVFCGRHLLVSYLRPSNIDPAKHSWAILSLLVKAIRQHWPKVEMVFRGDSGFCRWRMLRWCERHNVRYIVGIAKNKRLKEKAQALINQAQEQFEKTGNKQRLFTSQYYAAKTWDKQRRIIVKAEHNRLGSNPRFVITNLIQNDQYLYDKIYCARGDMENRIKDQQLGLFAHRASSHRWWNNQFRQLLSGLAYVLIEALRTMALAETSIAKATPQTLRLKLLRVGAVIVRNTRRIRIMISSAYPDQSLFTNVAFKLNSS